MQVRMDAKIVKFKYIITKSLQNYIFFLTFARKLAKKATEVALFVNSPIRGLTPNG